MLHKTKGIVLRCVKFGDTSIIATIFTEILGIQSYIIKGVRKASKKNSNNAVFFQPAAILDLEVNHNTLKNLQYIKEYSWSFLYQHVFFDVIKNAVVSFNMELLQQVLKQPGPLPELYEFVESSLHYADESPATGTANLPLYFMLQLGRLLGFQLSGEYDESTPVLDLQAGEFVHEIPVHPYFLINEEAKITSEFMHINQFELLEKIFLNQQKRRALLTAYVQYIKLHTEGMNDIKGFLILQEVLA